MHLEFPPKERPEYLMENATNIAISSSKRKVLRQETNLKHSIRAQNQSWP